MNRIFIIALLLCLLLPPVYSQDEELIQLSGLVKNELLEPIQFVHILIWNKRRGTISDQRGMFTFVVEPSDTIVFSAVGYKKTYLIIPESPKFIHYHVDVYMETDTIMIGQVDIYPWKTYEEFKEAFLSLELPDDDLRRAYRNIALIKTQILSSSSPTPDPNLNYQYYMKEMHDDLYTKGQTPYYSIFDPLRWRQFFEYLEKGKFKNPNKRKK